MDLDKVFENVDQIRISDQKIGKKLFINLIKRVNTKFGESYFILDKTNCVCYYANSLLKTFINKILDKLEQEYNTYFYKNKELDNILTIKIIGEETDRKGKTFQKFNINTFINGNVNTVKSFRTLDLGENDNED